jgi:hypothetical protein
MLRVPLPSHLHMTAITFLIILTFALIRNC